MKKPIELTDGIKVYAKSMGKLFRVYAICDTDKEANEYMEKHEDAAVIAQDGAGRVYIACKYESVCRSSAVLD